MAVVEVGAWCVRAGYVGDVACTRTLRAMCATAAPDETDFVSMLRCAASTATHDDDAVDNDNDDNDDQHDRRRRSSHGHGDGGASHTTLPSLLPLWTSTWQPTYTTSFAQHSDMHMASLRHLTHRVLGCGVSDPLLLVVPEAWHTQSQLPLMQQLFECVLEGGSGGGDNDNNDDNDDDDTHSSGALAHALYCLRPSVATALASGCASAVVLDVGHSHCTAAAVCDGYVLRDTVETCGVGGAHVTARLLTTLSSSALVPSLLRYYTPRLRDATALRCAVIDAVSDVKHACGFVRSSTRAATTTMTAAAADTNTTGVRSSSNNDNNSSADKAAAGVATLQLPDGVTVTLGEAECTDDFELLFARRAHKTTHKTDGDNDDNNDNIDAAAAATTTSTCESSVNVADMLVRCKQRLDPEWRVRALQHVIAGGTARTRGFSERLLHELKQRDAAYVRYERESAMHVARSADAAWCGASLAASSSSFAPLWVTRDEWHEEGTRVLCRKLFY